MADVEKVKFPTEKPQLLSMRGWKTFQVSFDEQTLPAAFAQSWVLLVFASHHHLSSSFVLLSIWSNAPVIVDMQLRAWCFCSVHLVNRFKLKHIFLFKFRFSQANLKIEKALGKSYCTILVPTPERPQRFIKQIPLCYKLSCSFFSDTRYHDCCWNCTFVIEKSQWTHSRQCQLLYKMTLLSQRFDRCVYFDSTLSFLHWATFCLCVQDSAPNVRSIPSPGQRLSLL